MKRSTMAKIGVAIAIRYRRLLVRLGLQGAKHPKRTVHIFRGGKTAVTGAREFKESPEAQGHARVGVKSTVHAMKRIRKLGADDARSDDRVISDLRTAAMEIGALVAMMQPEKPKHRVRKTVATVAVAGGAAYVVMQV